MSDELLPNDELQSLDELIEETKRQLDEMNLSDGMATDTPSELDHQTKAVLLQANDAPFFEPDFGDAFLNYGNYEEDDISRPTPADDEADSQFIESDSAPEEDAYHDFEEDYTPDDAAFPEENLAPEDFDGNLDDSQYVPDDSSNDPPAKKPKRSYHHRIVPVFVKVLLYVVLVGVIAVGLGYGLWECAADVMAFGRSSDMITVAIPNGSSLDDIANMLDESGVIKYPWLFKLYCDFTDSGEDLVEHEQEGDYETYGIYSISYNFDYHALTKGLLLNRTNCAIFRFTIPDAETGSLEGGRNIRIAFSKSLLEGSEGGASTNHKKLDAFRLMVSYNICSPEEILLLAHQNGVCTVEEVQLMKAALNNNQDIFALMERDGLCSGEELFSMMDQEMNGSTIRLTIPEGMTCAQVFAMMDKSGVCSAEDLEKCAAETEFDYWFLEEVPYGEKNRLEGYLFPDTYDFYGADDPERVLNKLLSNFERKLTDEAQAQLEVLNELLASKLANHGYDEEYIALHRFGVRELMIVASMIEKETAGADESGDIASVIYNRLTNPQNYPYLNIDATVIYALGGIDGALTQEDLQFDSPYNTYTNAGLPAGPISNPGLSSITAALYPSDTDYYFYALNQETGFHHFSETYDEHNSFLAGQNYD